MRLTITSLTLVTALASSLLAPLAMAQDRAPVASAPASLPAGQWVYTQQYGWIWMPYDQQYTHVTGDSTAYAYVWYPAVGWSWVAAPWVIGLGVTPYWGLLGPRHFAWYAHPWFHVAPVHPRPAGGHGWGRRVFAPHPGHRGRR